MIKIKEAIIVEGKYDKNTLSASVDAVIIETSGFGIYTDPQKLKLLRRMADHCGVVIMTDSDGAGFAIRNYLKSVLPENKVKHAYIPEIFGKERRKNISGKEGKLGVEGMSPGVLAQALENAGVSLTAVPERKTGDEKITKGDFFAAGLSGREGSALRRAELLNKLDLPNRLSAGALIDVLNVIMTREEFFERFC